MRPSSQQQPGRPPLPPGAQPLRSVIDFGESAQGGSANPPRIAAQHSMESGVQQQQQQQQQGGGGGVHHRAGHGAGHGGAQTVPGGGGLDFYAADSAAAGAAGGAPMGPVGNGASRGGGAGGAPPHGGGGGVGGGGGSLGKMPRVTSRGMSSAFLGEGFEDEPPILEELGVNMAHVWAKTSAVLLPTRARLISGTGGGGGGGAMGAQGSSFLSDADLAGPLLYALVLGVVLLLKGKVSFGSIYGVGAVGCGGMYTVLNLMSGTGIDIYRTVSVLGYCLLPIVLLAAVSVLVDLRGLSGYLLIPAGVLWCTHAASLFFTVQLSLDDQRWLVAYPVMLFYGAFALFTL